MAIPNGNNVLYASYVLEFMEQAKTLSKRVWQVELTSDDFIGKDILKSTANDMSDTGIRMFQDGKVHNKAEVGDKCDDTYTVVKDFVRISYDEGKYYSF